MKYRRGKRAVMFAGCGGPLARFRCDFGGLWRAQPFAYLGNNCRVGQKAQWFCGPEFGRRRIAGALGVARGAEIAPAMENGVDFWWYVGGKLARGLQ